MDKAMKSYDEIRINLIAILMGHSTLTMKGLEEMAAKEYAKQWIERVAEKAQTEMVPGGVKWIDTKSILNVKYEIDAHGKH
jgi:hypothetical protein